MAADVSRLAIFCVLFSLLAGTTAREKGDLYTEDDPVTILNNSTFDSVIYGQNHGWLVEFYNKWCGHCIRFAPTWIQLGENIKTWGKAFKIAAIDCADEKNVEKCREFVVSGYPTIKVLAPGAKKGDLGEENKDRAIDDFENYMLDYITKHADLFPKDIVSALEPLQSLGDIWNSASSATKHVVVIFEDDKDHYLGRKLILDYLERPSNQVVVRRSLKAEVEKFGVKVFPSLYRIDHGGNFEKLAEGDNPDGFDEAILKLLGEKKEVKVKKKEEGEDDFAGVGESEAKEENEEKKKSENLVAPAVHMQDIESALIYSLRHEIASCQHIEGERREALNLYIHVLANYFPGQRAIVRFLRDLDNILEMSRDPLTGAEWTQLLDSVSSSSQGAVLPPLTTAGPVWTACKGSQAKFRGYPCGLWTLFHTLVVGAVEVHSSHVNDNDMDPQEVLHAMQGYIEYFFGCRECAKNFAKMATRIEDEVRTAQESVLFLWSAHNKANKRLKGDMTEDPEFPKIQFPARDICPKCHVKNDVDDAWNAEQVYTFLLGFYGSKNLIRDSEELKFANGVKLTKEDLERRKVDVEKLRLIRMEKQQRKETSLRQQELEVLKKQRDLNPKIFNLKKRELDTRLNQSVVNFGWSGVDISMCISFYVVSAAIVLYLYFHFTVRRRMSVKSLFGSFKV